MARCRSPPPPARTASPASAEAGDLRCRSASTWLLFTSATAEGLCWTLYLMSKYSFSFLESLLHSSHLCVLAGPGASKLPVFLCPVSRPLWRVRTTLASTEQTQPSQPAMSSQQSLHSQGHPAPPLHHPCTSPHLVCTASSSWGLRRQENTLPTTLPPLPQLKEPRMLT